MGKCGLFSHSRLDHRYNATKGVRKHLTRRKHQVKCPISTPRRSEMRQKQWTNEQMVAAMKAVEDGVGAAHDHGVPYSTLKDRVNGRVVHDTTPVPKPYLNMEKESELGDVQV